MFSRRHVLQSSLALSATAALSSSSAAAAPLRSAIGHFVFDNRFAESRLLARRAAERGAAPWETAGDMTGLWCDHLKAAWDAAATPIAGITTRDGLFVLETLAADYRMRVLYRGEHAPPQDGRTIHRLAAAEAMMASLRSAGRRAWSARMAEAMTRYAPGAAATVLAEFDTPAEEAGRAVPLYSWIIGAGKRGIAV